MLIRLSLQNAKRTFGDYAIYVLTVSLMICLDFMLSRLIFSPELADLTESSTGLQAIFYFTSGVMMIVIFALIKYMTRFILSKRSKEFGLYQLMGIENKKITGIYWIEQCYLGAISLLVGLISGVLFGEILRSIVFNYIGCIDYHFTLDGMGASFLLTIVETVVIYILVKLTSGKLFKNRSILSWLQADKKNEKIKKNGIGRYLLTIFWVILGVISFVIIALNVDKISIGLILCCGGVLLLATFGFCTCIVRIISNILLRGDKQFTLRVLPVRFLSKKIATRSKQMGILAMLFVFSLGLMTIGTLFGNYIKEYNREYNNYDVYYTAMQEDNNDAMFEGLENIIQKYEVKDNICIPGYIVKECELYQLLSQFRYANSVVSLSTYNEVRKMHGLSPVSLEKDEFIIQAHMQLLNIGESFTKPEYHILGQNLKLKEIVISAMSTKCVGDQASYYAVLPDELLKDLTPDYYSYAYQLENKDYLSLAKEIREFLISNGEAETDMTEQGYYRSILMANNICVTQEIITESAFAFAGISVSMLMIGLIFAMVLCTVLAVLLTSDIMENKQRFLTLHRLGAGLNEQKKVIKKQIVSLFSLPVIIGIPLVAVICMLTAQVLDQVMTGSYMFMNSLFTIVGFLVIYGIYMLVTYRSLCKGVTIE